MKSDFMALSQRDDKRGSRRTGTKKAGNRIPAFACMAPRDRLELPT